MQTSWSERNRGVGRVCAVWSAKTRHFPSSRLGLCHAPLIGCNLSTNRKRKPKWRRCVAASIAVGPSATLTGSRTRPSDWGWNGRFGPVEDQRNNRRLATVTCTLRFGGCHPFSSDWGWNGRFGPVEDQRNNRRLATVTCTLRFGGCHLFSTRAAPTSSHPVANPGQRFACFARKCGMWNGEWGVRNAECGMGKERWQMTNGRWQTDGGWRMADGGWLAHPPLRRLLAGWLP